MALPPSLTPLRAPFYCCAHWSEELMSLSPVTEFDDELEQAGKPAGPCVMVVFGATGDLTMRKLVPALHNLEKAHLLPQEFAVLGVAIDDLSLEDFRKKVTRFLQAEDHG